MKCKSADELEGRGTSRISRPLKLFFICVVLVILTCFPLLSLLAAIGVIAGLIGNALGSLLAALFESIAYAIWLLLAYAVWLLLTGDWGQLVWWLFLWLLSSGLV